MTLSPQILSAYFDADLEPGEYGRLREWLHEDTNHVADFVVDGFIHAQLIDWLGPEQARANALVTARVVAESTQTGRARRVAGRWLAVAVSLALVAAMTYFVAVRPKVVATVTGTRNVQWVQGAKKQTVGALLQSGAEVSPDGGTLQLTFARGGQVAVHGPARFRVEADIAGRLLQGSLSAFVPEHAVGFTIRSGKLTAVDLGTEFYIELLDDESCELQVFDGLVEVQLEAPLGEGAADGKLQIPQGRAIRFDAKSGKVRSIEYDKTKRPAESVWSR